MSKNIPLPECGRYYGVRGLSGFLFGSSAEFDIAARLCLRGPGAYAVSLQERNGDRGLVELVFKGPDLPFVAIEVAENHTIEDVARQVRDRVQYTIPFLTPHL